MENAQARGGQLPGHRLAQLLDRLVVDAIHPPHSRADQPHQRVVVFRPVEQVCQVERYHREAIPGVDARVDIPYEPLVVMQDPLLRRRARRHARVVRAQQCPRGLDLVRLVQLPLQVRHADDDCEVPPHVPVAELQGLPDDAGSGAGGARDLGDERLLPLEAVEVLGEGPAARAQVVALHEDHGQGVKLVEGVQRAQEVARVPLRQDGQEVAERGRQQGVELLLGEDLEERGLLVVEGAPEGGDELHGSLLVSHAALWRTRGFRGLILHCIWTCGLLVGRLVIPNDVRRAALELRCTKAGDFNPLMPRPPRSAKR